MLFSIRKIVTQKAIEWCEERLIDTNPFNIVGALDALGFLKVSIPLKEKIETQIIQCELCSHTAIYLVKDTKWYNDRLLGMKVYEPIEPIHYFCAQHSRESQSTYGGDINIT